MKTNKVVYWISTGLVIVIVGLMSFGDILKMDFVREANRHLGFPDYVLPLFGTFKITGTLCAVLPAWIRFREAAYAGIFFFFSGAVYCHAANGDGIHKMILPFTILMVSIVSYVFSRKRESSVQSNN